MSLVNKNLNSANPFFSASSIMSSEKGWSKNDPLEFFCNQQQMAEQQIQRNQGQQNEQDQQQSQYQWLISADKIFSSELEGFEEYSRFFDLDFHIYKFSMSAEGKASDTSICAENVRIHIPNGSHCAVIQSNLANGKEISKIIIKKISFKLNDIATLEEKEFSNCFVQTFSRKGEKAIFSFRYSSYKDTYTDYKSDGTKKGTAGVSVDLVKWEIK